MWWQAFVTKVNRVVSSTSNCMPEDDWIASGRDVFVVDMGLAVVLPLFLTVYPLATYETELGIAVRFLEEGFVAVERVLSSERVSYTMGEQQLVLAFALRGQPEGLFSYLSIFVPQ